MEINRGSEDFCFKKGTTHNPPVDLYLIFEKSSCKNQVRQTGYTGSKTPVRNRLKIQFAKLDFSKLIFQKSSIDQQGDSVTKVCIRNFQGRLITEFLSRQ